MTPEAELKRLRKGLISRKKVADSAWKRAYDNVMNGNVNKDEITSAMSLLIITDRLILENKQYDLLNEDI